VRLRMMRDEQEALSGLAAWVHGPTLGGAVEVPPQAVALSPSSSLKLTESRVDAAASNRFCRGPAGANYSIVVLPRARGRVGSAGIQEQRRPDAR
jgi:hypothetical protein